MGVEVLVFQVDDRQFGVLSSSVVEVVRAVTLTPLPAASKIAEGLLNLRGHVVPVLDVRHLFGLPPKNIEHTDHLIVVQVDGHLVALRVDRATDLVPCPEESLQTADDVVPNSELIRVVTHIGDRIIHVLEVDRLLTVLRAAVPAVIEVESVNPESQP
jgi:purine-binding chemotaxis protein CheW